MYTYRNLTRWLAALSLLLLLAGCKEKETGVAVSGVSLSQKYLVLKSDETATLTALIRPENATNQDVFWSSGNERVATVAGGVVTGIAEGTTTVSVTTREGGFTSNCLVSVADDHVSSLSISPGEAFRLPCGSVVQFTATVRPESAPNKEVTWASSDESILAMDASTGLATALSSGTATVTATTLDGGLTATVDVTVYVAVESVSISPEGLVSVHVGKTVQLSATVSPEDADDKTVTWSTSDATVVTVSESGLVSGLQEGEAVVTVTTTDGGFTAAVRVSVARSTVNTGDGSVFDENDYGNYN